MGHDGPRLPRDSNLFCEGKEYLPLPLPSKKDCDRTSLPMLNASKAPFHMNLPSFQFNSATSSISLTFKDSFSPSFIDTKASRKSGSFSPTSGNILSKSESQSPRGRKKNIVKHIPTSSPIFIINVANINSSTIPPSKYKSSEMYNFATDEQKLARVLRISLCLLGTAWVFVIWRVGVKIFR